MFNVTLKGQDSIKIASLKFGEYVINVYNDLKSRIDFKDIYDMTIGYPKVCNVLRFSNDNTSNTSNDNSSNSNKLIIGLIYINITGRSMQYHYSIVYELIYVLTLELQSGDLKVVLHDIRDDPLNHNNSNNNINSSNKYTAYQSKLYRE